MEPYDPLPDELATRPFANDFWRILAISRSTKDGVNEYIGTGPCPDRFCDRWHALANENYWGSSQIHQKDYGKVIPIIRRVSWHWKGEIDLIFGKNMIDADALTSIRKWQLLRYLTSTRQIVNWIQPVIFWMRSVRYFSMRQTKQRHGRRLLWFEQPADTLYSLRDIKDPIWREYDVANEDAGGSRLTWRRRTWKDYQKWNWAFITAIVWRKRWVPPERIPEAAFSWTFMEVKNSLTA